MSAYAGGEGVVLFEMEQGPAAIDVDTIQAVLPSCDGKSSLVYCDSFPEGLLVVGPAKDNIGLWLLGLEDLNGSEEELDSGDE